MRHSRHIFFVYQSLFFSRFDRRGVAQYVLHPAVQMHGETGTMGE
jgi:hypothetical protein